MFISLTLNVFPTAINEKTYNMAVREEAFYSLFHRRVAGEYQDWRSPLTFGVKFQTHKTQLIHDLQHYIEVKIVKHSSYSPQTQLQKQ